MRRFFIEKDRKTGDIFLLKGHEAVHIIKVLRLKTGTDVELFDGKGTLYKAVITGKNREGVELQIKSLVPFVQSNRIVLAQSIVKANKMDLVVQKTTELGVSDIIAFFSERSVPVWDEKKIKSKTSHWQRIVVESIKQSGSIRRLPCVKLIKNFSELVKYPFEGFLKIMLWEGEKSRGLGDVLKSVKKQDIICLIGPEGGFSEQEVVLAKNAGFISAGLGKSILRAETAAIASMVIIGYESGGMGKSNE